jgi:hypothetical protein
MAGRTRFKEEIPVDGGAGTAGEARFNDQGVREQEKLNPEEEIISRLGKCECPSTCEGEERKYRAKSQGGH